MKFEVYTLRNKKVKIKNNIFKETFKVKRGDNSENISVRVMKLSHIKWLIISHIYLKFEVDTLRNKEIKFKGR